MLALAPALLVLAAANVQASPASAAAEALVARGAYGACDPKCTTFDAYYSACTSDAKSDACLAVCTPSEFTVYQDCLNCIEVDQAGVSFKSTLEKVKQRCVDNNRGDPTSGAGIKSMANPNATSHGSSSNSSAASNNTSKNSTGAGNPHAGLSSSSGAAAAAAETSKPSAASVAVHLSAAGVAASVLVGIAMLF